ncbi:Dual specificity tyrosine-phosphorylation-regulated kinase mbk-1 [Glycine max]|nr:Dual specificity tyrosine-phosphorylation-regulated kinase mbk-1 [Glycine max]
MAVSNGVEAVLEFLRKNGLSEAESALREDIIENTDLGTFDYEKFFFPMVPPPPPVRVRSFSRPSGLSAAGNCSISSSDEFVSIGGSPTSRVSSSENKELPIVLNTVLAGRYYVTEYLGSAAFSRVVQAHDLQTGIDFCLKIIKNDKDFFDQSLDEIKLLKLVNKHDPADKHHILRLYDYFYHQEHLFIVTELLRANLYEFQKFNQESGGEAYFTLNRLQLITRQCLEALQYLHSLGIVHCDLKPENILIKSYRRCEIKVIDLGSSCFQTDNLCLYVQSRSYRAPEVMLGLQYDEKIDLWSLGCILAELCSGEVLFPNDAVVMILARMIGMLGSIDMEMLVKGQETHKYFTKEYDIYYVNEETDQLEYIIPEESSLEQHLQVTDTMFIDFVRYLLSINPKRRPSARQALRHPWLSYVY